MHELFGRELLLASQRWRFNARVTQMSANHGLEIAVPLLPK
jgi:hypothetical protein